MTNLIGFIPPAPTKDHYRVKNLTGEVIETNKKTVKVLFNILDNDEVKELILDYPANKCEPHFATTKTVNGLTFFEFQSKLKFLPQSITKWELFWSGYKIKEV